MYVNLLVIVILMVSLFFSSVLLLSFHRFSSSLSSSSSFLKQYRYQDEDSPPEHGFPRLTNEVRAPELVHVSEKNLSEIENVHGYVSHSHISPLKVSKCPVLHPQPSEQNWFKKSNFYSKTVPTSFSHWEAPDENLPNHTMRGCQHGVPRSPLSSPC